MYSKDFSKAVCEGVAAQKRLMELGMKSEPLMLLEDMLEIVPDEFNTGDPAHDLHEYEDEYMSEYVAWRTKQPVKAEDEFMLRDGTVAYDDQSGAALKPALMGRRAKKR